MSAENQVISTQIQRTPPNNNIFPLVSESPLAFAKLYFNINLPGGVSLQQMTSLNVGECLLVTGDWVEAIIGKDQISDGVVVLGVWSQEKCPKCPFNPDNPVMKEFICKIALKPNLQIG